MARAKTVTWLSLDRFAQYLGLNPLSFNQLHSDTLQLNNVCGGPWFQEDWQHSDRIGREGLAQAIRQAERNMAREAGFNLLPDWTVAERLPYPQPFMPGAFGVGGLNARGQFKSIEAPRGHILTGGVRAQSAIQIGAGFALSDGDTDGYQETCTATVPTTVTDPSEIRLFYPGKNGAAEWEIRPIEVTLSGGNAIIVFKRWQVAAAIAMDSLNAQVLDADDPNSYETAVDVYRIYNDPSVQVQFIWEAQPDLVCSCGSSTCTACQLGTQAGCFHLRDQRRGVLVPAPASWDAENLEFDSAEWSGCREPDQVRLWYYSGWMDNSLQRPYVTLDNYWESAIAYYAASLLDRTACGCSNAEQFISHWRMDAAFRSQEQGGFNLSDSLMSNKLGTTMGALNAYKRIHQNGVIVNK